MESSPQPVSEPLLRRYFYSGWAFFMPYLFLYLLYYWRKWPVNPGSGSHVPSLLHVYWALHAINMILGLLTLCAWHQHSRRSTLNPQPSVFQSFSLSAFLPWVLLALIFYIPGAYLEWPSDPWEHLRRINEWSAGATVGAHSEWYKSSYFFAYSLVGEISAIHQLAWLDVYYTAICLLLCWQYYRLALATGLSERLSMIFVLLQVLLFGNSAFSYYRYYGISSSIYAQVGSVALVRLGLEAAAKKSLINGLRTSFSSFAGLTSVFWFLASACCLLAFTASNHTQGLGIAALGLSAVVIWRLIAWKRSAFWWFAAAMIALSAIAIWKFPRDPNLDQLYRPQGWLSPWYGFNILSLKSPAGDRMLQILGTIGVVNLVAGLLLLRRNNAVGWLTVMPMLALSVPFIAIPLSGVLGNRGAPINIVVFQRMFFAIPPGLALVSLFQQLFPKNQRNFCAKCLPLATVGAALVVFLTVPAGGPHYNHTWNAFFRTPDDLCMKAAWLSHAQLPDEPTDPLFVATTGIGWSKIAQHPGSTLFFPERTGCVPAANLSAIRLVLAPHAPANAIVIVPRSNLLYTPYSFAALCSLHWLPQETALAFAGANELRLMSSASGLKPLSPESDRFTYFSWWK